MVTLSYHHASSVDDDDGFSDFVVWQWSCLILTIGMRRGFFLVVSMIGFCAASFVRTSDIRGNLL